MRTEPYKAKRKAVQQRLYTEGPVLPPRLVQRGHLPWLSTYTTQLKTEGKSVNTQKSYMVGLRHLIETPLPGEDIISEFERDSMDIEQLLERVEPFNGRLDLWVQSMVDRSPSTVKARLAAANHLMNWLGQKWPEHLIRPKSGKKLPRTLTSRELSLVKEAAACSEDPVANLIVTMILDTGLRVSELCELNISDIDGLAVAGLWGMPGPGVMQPNVLTEYLGISYPKWLDGTNTGGSAFIFHLQHAYQAIKNNICTFFS